ncbi:MAG: hypothetical protein ACW99U_17185 [Candidatus Thorarchaeota archaeon]|jgi:hypothetical protein
MDIQISGPVGMVASAIAEVVRSAFDYAEAERATMDPELRKRMDLMRVKLFERFVSLICGVIPAPEDEVH